MIKESYYYYYLLVMRIKPTKINCHVYFDSVVEKLILI